MKYIESKDGSSKDLVRTDSLDGLVRKTLRTDMTDKNTRLRIKNWFISCRSILRGHGLSWIIDYKQKGRFLSYIGIRPDSLCAQFESDIELSQYEPWKYFKGFRTHKKKLSEAL